MLNAIKKFFEGKKNSLKNLSIPACVAAATASASTFAFAVTAEDLIGQILKTIFTIAGYIGVLLLVWGIVILVLAIRNEDADSKSRAVLFIVVAIALICLGALFGPVLQLLGYTIG